MSTIASKSTIGVSLICRLDLERRDRLPRKRDPRLFQAQRPKGTPYKFF